MPNPALKEQFHELTQKTVHHLHDARDKLKLVSKDAAAKVDAKAHENPWHFVGVTALLSVVMGFLLGRKSKG